MTPDGRLRRLLFKAEFSAGDFSVCRNGRFIILGRSSLGKAEQQTIWRTDAAAGHNMKQLTEGPFDLYPDCSPDGQSVIYWSRSNKGGRLMRVSIDGGAPTVLKDMDNAMGDLQYSPDGREIADIEKIVDVGSGEKVVLVVRNAQSGQAIKLFDLPPGLFFARFEGSTSALRWTPDGKSVYLHPLEGCCCQSLESVVVRWPSASDHKFFGRTLRLRLVCGWETTGVDAPCTIARRRTYQQLPLRCSTLEAVS